MKTPDSDLDLRHDDPDEARLLASLKAWGSAPVEAPDLDVSRETQRKVVARMALVVRNEHVARRARRRRTVALLVAVAAVLALGSTALAFVAGQHSAGHTFERSRAGLGGAVVPVVRSHPFLSTMQPAPPPDGVASADPSTASSAGLSNTASTSAPSSAGAERPVSTHPDRPAPTSAPSARTVSPPTASELAEQNRLFLAAMAARRRGDDAETVRACDELLSRYPQSPLAPEARAERANAAARLSKTP